MSTDQQRILTSNSSINSSRNKRQCLPKRTAFTATWPIPCTFYGPLSPLALSNNIEGPVSIEANLIVEDLDLEQLNRLFINRQIPEEIPETKWLMVDRYLDIPTLKWVADGTWSDRGDEVLWLRRTNFQSYEFPKLWVWAAKNGHLETLKWIEANGGAEWAQPIAANNAAANGHLEVLQWIRANGGEWTSGAANGAAANGHLEILQWIHANGGDWTPGAANWAAANGHLKVLQWIRANGGDWTSCAANWAAENGHLEILQWIRANGGEWTSYAADGAANNGHLEILQWIRANGGKWTSYAANWAARNGHLEVLQWIWTNGGKWTDDAADGAAQNQHLEVFEWICAHDGLVNSVIVDLK